MSTRQPRYSLEQHARRGKEIYERVIRPRMTESDHGKVVAIDTETENYEIDDDPMEAADRLLARLPDAQIWRIRIGDRGVHRFGYRVPVTVP